MEEKQKFELPKYLPDVLGLKLGSGVHHIEVRHDSWCPLLLNNGKCACSPDVVVVPDWPDKNL